MKTITKLIIFNLLSIIFVLGGIFLAIKGVPRWGWLIFLGAAQGVVTSTREK